MPIKRDEWPNPPSLQILEKVEAARRHHKDELVKVAQLSPENQVKLDAIVTDLNKEIQALFDELVAEKMKTGTPIPDEVRSQFLTTFGEAIQSADAAAANLSPEAAAAVGSTFLMATQLDPENAMRMASFHRRYLAGNEPPPSTRPQ